MMDVAAMNIARKSVHTANKLQPTVIKTTSIDREGLDPTRKIRGYEYVVVSGLVNRGRKLVGNFLVVFYFS